MLMVYKNESLVVQRVIQCGTFFIPSFLLSQPIRNMKLLQQQSAALFAVGIASLTGMISANEVDDSCVIVYVQETVIASPVHVKTVVEENQNIIIAPGMTIEVNNAPTYIDIYTTVLGTTTERNSFWHGQQ
jgi:hypothetical protein